MGLEIVFFNLEPHTLLIYFNDSPLELKKKILEVTSNTSIYKDVHKERKVSCDLNLEYWIRLRFN